MKRLLASAILIGMAFFLWGWFGHLRERITHPWDRFPWPWVRTIDPEDRPHRPCA